MVRLIGRCRAARTRGSPYLPLDGEQRRVGDQSVEVGTGEGKAAALGHLQALQRQSTIKTNVYSIH